MDPPGAAYEEWFIPAQNVGSLPGELDAQCTDFLDRIQRLGPLYGNEVPMAALHLDMCLDSGKIAVLDGEEPRLVDFEGLVGRIEEGMDGIRQSTHRLHATGALLVDVDEEHDIPFVRFVLKRPGKPGEPWAFVGDNDTAAATTCLPNAIWFELDPDVAAAVAYLRGCLARLEQPAFADFVEHHQDVSVDEARRLWDAAWASGFVDHKGCEACPTGHLCTRQDAAT
ncbi:hypothetical protein ABZ135_23325 [Streptomyces sp. NPDC006339]|uniref:hypothetical protein n=1 Tax=Streptomyces sp. NPDC006339 TaxID=3156755 RepID=UPI0033B3083F